LHNSDVAREFFSEFFRPETKIVQVPFRTATGLFQCQQFSDNIGDALGVICGVLPCKTTLLLRDREGRP